MNLHLDLSDKVSSRAPANFIRVICKILGPLFLIGGFFVIGFAILAHFDGKDAQNWSSHVAKIGAATLESRVIDDEKETYLIKVLYQYEWNGLTYRGDRYRLHSNSSRNYQRQYSILTGLQYAQRNGTDYEIFVDPKNPENSVINNDFNPNKIYGDIIFGMLFSFVGYILTFHLAALERLGTKLNQMNPNYGMPTDAGVGDVGSDSDFFD